MNTKVTNGNRSYARTRGLSGSTFIFFLATGIIGCAERRGESTRSPVAVDGGDVKGARLGTTPLVDATAISTSTLVKSRYFVPERSLQGLPQGNLSFVSLTHGENHGLEMGVFTSEADAKLVLGTKAILPAIDWTRSVFAYVAYRGNTPFHLSIVNVDTAHAAIGFELSGRDIAIDGKQIWVLEIPRTTPKVEFSATALRGGIPEAWQGLMRTFSMVPMAAPKLSDASTGERTLEQTAAARCDIRNVGTTTLEMNEASAEQLACYEQLLREKLRATKVPAVNTFFEAPFTQLRTELSELSEELFWTEKDGTRGDGTLRGMRQTGVRIELLLRQLAIIDALEASDRAQSLATLLSKTAAGEKGKATRQRRWLAQREAELARAPVSAHTRAVTSRIVRTRSAIAKATAVVCSAAGTSDPKQLSQVEDLFYGSAHLAPNWDD